MEQRKQKISLNTAKIKNSTTRMHYKFRNNLIVPLKFGQLLQIYKKTLKLCLKGEENVVKKTHLHLIFLGVLLGIFFCVLMGGFFSGCVFMPTRLLF